MGDTNAVVVIHYNERGEINYHAIGDGLRLFIVDDRASDDRVYEWLSRSEPEEFVELVPEGSVIGNRHDARHEAVAGRVRAFRAGRRHLEAVAPRPAADLDRDGGG